MVEKDEELPDDQPKVFLSYSRHDRERAQLIAEVLRDRAFGVFKDTDDILPTEEWRGRLEQLIEEADTIVFLLSPHSANSEVCAWEVDYASSLNKRIAPIVINEVDTNDIPPPLAKLNFIFATERDPFEDAVDTLVSALNTDIDWIREHTRLNGLAGRWEIAKRPNHLLLRGQDIADAETWRDAHPSDAPSVTSLQAAFISSSRNAASRRQRLTVVGSLAVMAVTIGLMVLAWFQSIEADTQRAEAVKQRSSAEAQRDIAEEQRSIAEVQKGVAETEREKADQRRIEVMKSLAAGQLRNGERAKAVEVLAEIAESSGANNKLPASGYKSTRLKILLSGLTKAGDQVSNIEAGSPFRLNGKTFMRTGDSQSTPAVKNFPAEWIIPLADQTVLISSTGAIQVRDKQSGNLITDNSTEIAENLCFWVKTAENSATVISTNITNYSACGINFAAVSVSKNKIGKRLSHTLCDENDAYKFGKNDALQLSIKKVADACLYEPSIPARMTAINQAYAGNAPLNPMLEIPEIRFPLNVPETTLWLGIKKYTPMTSTKILRQEFDRRKTGLPENFRITAIFEWGDDNELPGYLFPHIVENKNLSVIEGVHAWGGTGGEAHYVCVGQSPDSKYACHEVSTFSGFRGIRLSDEKPLAVVYGNKLSFIDYLNGEGSNAFILSTAAPFVRSIQNITRYGTIYGGDFSPDTETLALLTNDSILLYRYSGKSDELLQVITPPKNTRAMEWLGNNTILTVSKDGKLYVASTPDFEFTLFGEAGFIDEVGSERYVRDRLFWIAKAENQPVIAVGFRDKVQLFDIELRAALNDPVVLADPQLADGSFRSTPLLKVDADGTVEISVNLRKYQRIAPTPNVPISEYTNPDRILTHLSNQL